MTKIDPTNIGRISVILAIFLQASGKVSYGTFLWEVSAPFFVFISFVMATLFFLVTAHKGVGKVNWVELFCLNLTTAITFLSYFYALKLIEPSIVGALEQGIGPIFTLLILFFTIGARPTLLNVLVSCGILASCYVLGTAAMKGGGFTLSSDYALLGLLASIVTGICSVLTILISKNMIKNGWSYGSILAHRFYLIIPISFILATQSNIPFPPFSWDLAFQIFIISAICVVLPLYLFQIGIGLCDPYTIMVMGASMPLITFLLQGFSPVYNWTWLTTSGLLLLTACLVIDSVVDQKSKRTPTQSSKSPAT